MAFLSYATGTGSDSNGTVRVPGALERHQGTRQPSTVICTGDVEMPPAPPAIDDASDDEASETLKALQPLKKPTSPTEVVTKAEMVPIVNALDYLVRSMMAASRNGNSSRTPESARGRNYRQESEFLSPTSLAQFSGLFLIEEKGKSALSVLYVRYDPNSFQYVREVWDSHHHLVGTCRQEVNFCLQHHVDPHLPVEEGISITPVMQEEVLQCCKSKRNLMKRRVF